MVGLEVLTECLSSGFTVCYGYFSTVTLQEECPSGTDQVWLTHPYTLVLFVSTVILLIYYYMWLPINWVQDEPQIRILKKYWKNQAGRLRHLGDLPPTYPNGWFAILESRDLQNGQVKHVQALGENFAVMRTNAGEVHVLDAYCPHLGANMAVGGVVRGDCLECPFHGWQFRGKDGVCSHIPYSDKVPKTAFVKKWISNEVNGHVFVWYHAEGDPPSYELKVIPDIKTGKMWYRGRCELHINTHVQDILENEADALHFKTIHKPSVFAGSDISTWDSPFHHFLQHIWVVDWKQNSAPGESHTSTLTATHHLKLFNKFVFKPDTAILTQTGPGYMVSRNQGFCTVITVTPIAPLRTKMIFHVHCLPHFYIIAGVFLYVNLITSARDNVIWSQKKYMIKPSLIKEEESIVGHRRWFSQFYTENSPKFPFRKDSMLW